MIAKNYIFVIGLILLICFVYFIIPNANKTKENQKLNPFLSQFNGDFDNEMFSFVKRPNANDEKVLVNNWLGNFNTLALEFLEQNKITNLFELNEFIKHKGQS